MITDTIAFSNVMEIPTKELLYWILYCISKLLFANWGEQSLNDVKIILHEISFRIFSSFHQEYTTSWKIWAWSVLTIFFKLNSLAWCLCYDCSNTSERTMKNLSRYITWIHQMFITITKQCKTTHCALLMGHHFHKSLKKWMHLATKLLHVTLYDTISPGRGIM